MFFKAEPWAHEGMTRSWRWKRAFAFFPVRTFDAGWIWMRLYWRWQCSWGWDFWDDYPYLTKEGHE